MLCGGFSGNTALRRERLRALNENDSREEMALATLEKKTKKREVDEEMVDRIVAETQQQKNFKERMYDKVTIPVWALDILIVVLVAALVLVMIFGRG